MTLSAGIAADALSIMSDHDTMAISIGGVSRSVSGIYSNAYTLTSESGMGVEGAAPAAIVPSASVPGINHNDTVTPASGAVHYVVGIHPDGTGMTVLTLSLDPDQS